MSALSQLLDHRRFGMRPGLANILAASEALGSPHLKLGKVVHVAGTNGKGQVCALLDASLRAAGFKVGRYTSPHLVKVNERFFLDGRMIADRELEALAQKVLPVAENLTYFEALTLMAFCYYAEAKCDYTILETGLGGRLDATNICRPALAVITKIGLDHCDWLGGTIAEIAREKAGIAKPGVPLVLGPNSDEVRRLIPADFQVEATGDFVAENRATAAQALAVLGVYQPLADTVWPGRLSEVGDIVIDGAHNPPGAEALKAALAKRHPGVKWTLVYGACGDKDIGQVLQILRPLAKTAYAVKSANPRGVDAGKLCAIMQERGFDARPATLDILKTLAGPVLVCGSLFLAGEALALLGAYPWGEIRFDPEEALK